MFCNLFQDLFFLVSKFTRHHPLPQSSKHWKKLFQPWMCSFWAVWLISYYFDHEFFHSSKFQKFFFKIARPDSLQNFMDMTKTIISIIVFQNQLTMFAGILLKTVWYLYILTMKMKTVSKQQKQTSVRW